MNDINRNIQDRNSTNHISENDLMLFALQFLPEEEAAAVAAHLRQCEVCRMAIGEIQGDLAAYALTSGVQELPAQARERFLRRVANEKKLVPIDRHQPEVKREPVLAARTNHVFESYGRNEPVSRGRGAVAMAWIGWALAAGIGVFAFLQFQQRQLMQSDLLAETAGLTQATNRARTEQDEAAKAQEALQTLTAEGAMQVSLHLPAVKAPLPEAHAAYIASKGSLVLVASHLHPLAAGKTYELWLLPATPGQQPVPAGTFKPDVKGYASVILPSLPKGVPAKGFGVTIEPEGGSPAPTPPIVLAGM
jgi:hypothetical protein